MGEKGYLQPPRKRPVSRRGTGSALSGVSYSRPRLKAGVVNMKAGVVNMKAGVVNMKAGVVNIYFDNFALRKSASCTVSFGSGPVAMMMIFLSGR